MTTCAERVAFATKHIKTKEGKAFSLKGRDWVEKEFWGPADGFKLWPNDHEALCGDCSGIANSVIADWVPRHASTHARHLATGCKGLGLHPIIMTVLNLPRREGKTFNTACYLMSVIGKERNRSATYVAAAENQTDQLFYENFERPIEQSTALSKAFSVVGGTVTCLATKSFVKCVSTSHSSITGTGRTHVVLDEARDIDGRVAAALIPSVFDNNGVECPNGHVFAAGADEFAADGRARKCKVCSEPLRPWWARLIIESSSGLMDGGSKDWFPELVSELETTPDQNAHLFRVVEGTNPNVSQRTRGLVSRVLGKLPALKDSIAVEMDNTARRKGDDFLSSSQLDPVMDHNFINSGGSIRRCVGFLDTSTTQDATSLAIGEDTSDGLIRWDQITITRLDAWEPRKMKGGLIDEQAIFDHLEWLLPLFAGLIKFRVDTRVQPWAKKLVQACRRHPWGRKVEPFEGKEKARDGAWLAFEQRVLGGRAKIILPYDKSLRSEILGLEAKMQKDGGKRVQDRKRHISHADRADSVAQCCLMAHEDLLAGRGVRLTDTDKPASALAHVYRPTMRGLGENSF